MGRDKQIRNACYTAWKNTTEVESKHLKYHVVGKETCPTTGKEHWQGYIEFSMPKTITKIKKILGSKEAHIEARKGSAKEAAEYCKKDGDFIEVGELSKQGERTDLEELCDLIKDEKLTVKDVILDHSETYCKYRNGLRDLCHEVQRLQSKEFRQITTEVYWGEAGVGKTRKAVEENPDHYRIQTNDEHLWWDGYSGEKTIILDEFYGGIKYGLLLEVLDGYQLRLPVKGGFTYANWDKVVITSNKPPAEWYTRGMTPALKRRLTKVTVMRKI